MRGRSRLIRALIVVSAFVLLLAVPAVADVDNGGFESPVPSGAWDVFPSSQLGDWTVEWTEPATACGGSAEPVLEIQKSGTVVPAHSGNQYAELDTDCGAGDVDTNVKISQTLDVTEGYNYDLSYAFRQRTTSDRMDVIWPGGTASEVGVTTDWTVRDFTFTADATTTLSFEETGPANTLGMFLDSVACDFCISDETVTDLVYGRRNIDVGDISVTHDDDYIYVNITTDDPWVIYKTHVEIADDPADFPQNSGGLIPGQFTYGSGPFVPGTMDDTVMIPIPAGPGDYYLAVHTELFEVSGPGMYWASNVVSATQGLRNDGSAVLLSRSTATDVLGAPDGAGPPFTGFYSLGFGGSIVIEFDEWIYNGAGDDLAGVEVTSGSGYPLETAMVEFYYDGTWYPAVGQLSNGPTGLQRTTFVEMPAWMPYAEKVKITDTTLASAHNALADGFDLDAVKARYLWLGEESGWGDGEKGEWKNWSMYFDFEFNCPR